MPWRYDAAAIDIVWSVPAGLTTDEAIFDIGDAGSDVGFDSGSRENTTTIIDQGARVIEE